MKNLFESMSVALVLLLSLLIIVLIVQYNRIEEVTLGDVTASLLPAKAVVGKQKSTTNYLNKLEGYADVDVKVDPTQEDSANRVIVKSEITDNRMGRAVADNINEKKDVSDTPISKEEGVDEISTEMDEALKDLE